MTLDVADTAPIAPRLRAIGHNAVTAVLIVKDEEALLPRCLASLRGFVDAVVVYDTGSKDRTREVARAHGAHVVDGSWDDDFAAARNRALACADGEWVLSVDADDVVVGSPEVFRAHLRDYRTDVFELDYVSLSDDGGATDTMRVARLFRRALVRWSGALHEQLVPARSGQRLRQRVIATGFHLQHTGYRSEEQQGKGKAARNLRIAQSSHRPEVPQTTVNLGRALFAAGHAHAAVEAMAPLLQAPADARSMVLAGRSVVPHLVQARDEVTARAWIASARKHGEAAGQLTTWQGALDLALGRLDEARTSLERVLSGGGVELGTDPWGLPFDPATTAVLLTGALLASGQERDAAALMHAEVQRVPDRVNVRYAHDVLLAGGRTPAEVVAAAPPAFLERALRDMAAADQAAALAWFTAHHDAHPADVRPLVAGSVVAAGCNWQAALDWSVRAREHGVEGLCALTDLTAQEWRSTSERAVGLTFLVEGFHDEGARSRLAALLASLAAPEMHRVVRHVHKVVPGAELPVPTA